MVPKVKIHSWFLDRGGMSPATQLADDQEYRSDVKATAEPPLGDALAFFSTKLAPSRVVLGFLVIGTGSRKEEDGKQKYRVYVALWFESH